MAVFSIQLTRNPYQTGEPRGLSPSGGNSAANLFSLVCPAPYGRGVGVKGHCPLREPEGLSPDGGLFYSTNKESTPDPRAVAPIVPRR